MSKKPDEIPAIKVEEHLKITITQKDSNEKIKKKDCINKRV